MKASLDRAKENLFIALGIDIVFSLLITLSFIWVADIVGDVKTGVYQVTQSLVDRIDFFQIFSISQYIASTAVGIMIIIWSYKCYDYAKIALKQTGFKQEAWRIWGWVIPVISWVKPYQIINEIYKVGIAKNGGYGNWQNVPSSAWLIAWWLLWVIIHIIDFMITKTFHIKEGSLTNYNEIYIIEYSYWVIMGCLISIVIDALWFIVVGRLTGNLVNK